MRRNGSTNTTGDGKWCCATDNLCPKDCAVIARGGINDFSYSCVRVSPIVGDGIGADRGTVCGDADNDDVADSGCAGERYGISCAVFFALYIRRCRSRNASTATTGAAATL